MTTAAEAIREAMDALGGEADAHEVKDWVEVRYPGGWIDITVDMADLTTQEIRRRGIRLVGATSNAFDVAGTSSGARPFDG